MIHPSAILYPNIHLGHNTAIGAFAIIGEPALRRKSGECETKIGDDSTIRSHTVIYAGNTIGHNFQTGHGVLIREENKIGDNVSIGSHSVIEHHVTIGQGVRIHSQAFVPEYTMLEDNCWLGPNVVLTNARYPLSQGVKERLQGPIIQSGAKIGANVTILSGVIIGENALIGAGAVVVKNVPNGKVVSGNPAKIIRDVLDIEVYR